MICQRALSLLDDFLDNDLPDSTAAEVKTHLDGCITCRSAYDECRRLKELLKQKGNRDPGEDYWLETSQLILARTTQQSRPAGPYAAMGETSDPRGSFVQALVSLAASLLILISAVIVGMNQSHAPDAGIRGGPVLFSSSVERQLDQGRDIITAEERQRLAKGMLLLGPPGLLGHIGGLTQLRIVTAPQHQ